MARGSVAGLLLVICLAVARSSADDQDQRRREAEQLANKDLEAWTTAVAAKDRETQARLLNDALNAVREAESQMQRLGRLSGVSVNLMQRLADASCPPQLRMFFPRQLT